MVERGRKMSGYNYKTEEYPYNLIYALVSRERELPDDILESLDFVIDTLTEVEKTVLLCRYKEKMAFHQIANRRQCSDENCRSICDRAERKIRRGQNKFILWYGVKKCKEIEMEILSSSENFKKSGLEFLGLTPRTYNLLRRSGCETVEDVLQFREEQYSLRKGVGSVSVAEVKTKILDKYKELKEKEIYASKESFAKSNISDLDLSERSFNCLRRDGCQIVQDVLKIGLDDLIKIKNLGRICYDEILQKIFNIYENM